MAKKFVRIQSSINITVTPGLQHQNVTNPDAHVPDRLKVAPEWPRAMVDIRQGAGLYPAAIAEWPTVKALAKDKILTIGEFVEKADQPEQEEVAEKLERSLESIKEKTSKKEMKKEAVSLNEIAGE